MRKKIVTKAQRTLLDRIVARTEAQRARSPGWKGAKAARAKERGKKKEHTGKTWQATLGQKVPKDPAQSRDTIHAALAELTADTGAWSTRWDVARVVGMSGPYTGTRLNEMVEEGLVLVREGVPAQDHLPKPKFYRLA